MKIQPDDWKLTAYALGELDDADRAVVEAAVHDSPGLQAIVDEIRATADVLSADLAADAGVGLTSAQRATLESSAARQNGRMTTPEPVPIRPIIRKLWAPAALAASIALVAGVVYISQPSLSRSRGLATGIDLRGGSTFDNANAPIPPGPAASVAQPRLEPERRKSPKSVRKQATSNGHGQTGGGGQIAAGDSYKMSWTKDGTTTSVARSSNGQPQTAPGLRVSTHTQAGTTPSVADARIPASTAAVAPRALRSLGYVDGSNDGGPAKDGNRFRISGSGSGAVRERFYDFEEGRGEAVIFLDYDPAVGDSVVRRRIRRRADRKSVRQPEPYNRESYAYLPENPFLRVLDSPLSTFSIDVDTASYANVRRFLQSGQLPPPGAVRIEELVNYFTYDYPQPMGSDPFSVNVEVADCPWNANHRLARVGLRGYEIEAEDRPPANLVFLIDVSGSMNAHNKLPLLKTAMIMLTTELNDYDYVSMVVYAGNSGLVLPSTPVENRATIIDAVGRLQAGGSTNGGAGIQLAYQQAVDNFIEDGVNRVILATDGDFNVGISDEHSLVRLIEEKAKSGVFLSVLGFGMGNFQDAKLETLADKGNGNYAYIDSAMEAEKVLVEQIGGTLITIAKDVKIQVEFNPAEVEAYRLVGYENRMLAARDFNDDRKDAGEIGAGHTVTAFYEIVPAGEEVDLPSVDPLKYQTATDDSDSAFSGELMNVKLRYKQPDGDTSRLIELPVADSEMTLADASDDFVFAASVASFGMLLRHSNHSGDFDLDAVYEWADGTLGDDPDPYRAEFVELVQRAIALSTPGDR